MNPGNTTVHYTSDFDKYQQLKKEFHQLKKETTYYQEEAEINENLVHQWERKYDLLEYKMKNNLGVKSHTNIYDVVEKSKLHDHCLNHSLNEDFQDLEQIPLKNECEKEFVDKLQKSIGELNLFTKENPVTPIKDSYMKFHEEKTTEEVKYLREELKKTKKENFDLTKKQITLEYQNSDLKFDNSRMRELYIQE